MNKYKKYKIIYKSLNDVIDIISINFIPEIIIKKTKYIIQNSSVMGYYTRINNIPYIILNPDLFKFNKKFVKKSIYHEIGHYIHDYYFQFVPQYLPRKHHGNPDYYCNTNQKESFATAFADLIYFYKKGKIQKIKNSKRLSKLYNILDNSNLITKNAMLI